MSTIEMTLQKLEASMRLPENRTPERMAPLLAEEFREFGSSGRSFTKSEVLTLIDGQPYVPMTASDFKVQMLSPDVGLITYKVQRHSTPPLLTLRSSVWREVSGRWQLVFHQGTVVPVS